MIIRQQMNNHQGDRNHPQQHNHNRGRAMNKSSRAMNKSSQENAANQMPPPPPQKCPRCDSTNTKFCYYNNYSLSQPRYFCKSCRRYWTHGGTLRNVPVGGGCRKGNKRPKLTAPSSSTMPSTNHLDQIARSTTAHHVPSLSSSPSATRAFSSQTQSHTGNLVFSSSGGGNHHQNHLMRANTNPLMMNSGNTTPNYQYTSSGTGTGCFSSLGMVHQSLTPRYHGGIFPASGNNGQFGGNSSNMALLQGMNFQPLKAPDQVSSSLTTQQMNIPHHQAQNDHRFVGWSHKIQQRPPLGSWTQGFINNVGAENSSSMAPSTSSWTGANVGDHSDHVNNQAGTSSFDQNHQQWTNSNRNQGFDSAASH